jgi:hypothetical protein
MRTRLAIVATILAAFAASSGAHAQQQLIPTPFPSNNESGRILSEPPSSRRQVLLPTPYARKLGPNALGNPRITRPHRHQRLVPAPYPRQYR